MSFVKETGSCAPDTIFDRVKTHTVTANPQTMDATTVRLVKFLFLLAAQKCESDAFSPHDTPRRPYEQIFGDS